VLTAMGLSANEAARALRFSAGWLTTAADWSGLLNAVKMIQHEFQASVVTP
jgi:cysteine desulfurase